MKELKLSADPSEILKILGEESCILSKEGRCIKFLADLDNNNLLPSNLFLVSENLLGTNPIRHTVGYTLTMTNLDSKLSVYFDSLPFLFEYNLTTFQSLKPEEVMRHEASLMEVYEYLAFAHLKGICKLVLSFDSNSCLSETYVDRYQIQSYLASKSGSSSKSSIIV